MTKADWAIMVLMQAATELKLDFAFVNRFVNSVKEQGFDISEVLQ